MKNFIKRTGEYNLVNLFLLLFMTLLLLYTAWILLAKPPASQDANTIDIIIRTSAAAIFGYFLSSSFRKTDSDLSAQEVPSVPASRSTSRIQITAVASIGLLSLLLLFLARGSVTMTPEFSAAVSQLRDFVSAAIGFLVSCGKSQ